MRKKNIVMFYGKLKLNENFFFERQGVKNDIYKYFFEKGASIGFNMYFVSGAERYLGKLKFLNPLFYNGKKFVRRTGVLEADAVLDKSGGLKFPTRAISHKVVNPLNFKKICWDKVRAYKLLKKYMPEGYSVNSKKELLRELKNFGETELAVLKPATGLGGEGVVIDRKKILKKVPLKRKLHILQKFVDTSKGIPGIVRGRHDLRIAIANGKVVLAHVRTPKEGSLLANVAQGGSIREIPLNKIPKTIIEITHEIQSLFDEKYNYPLYGLDFGIENGRPYVFEINDQIGFPSKKMKNAKLFVNEILTSIKRLS